MSHEKSDVHVPSLAKGLVALLVLTAVSVALMAWMFDYLADRERLLSHPSEMATKRVIPPSPRLQVQPSTDLGTLLEQEEKILSTYGWVDKQAGVVRIPVERAMELLVQRSKR